MLQTDHLEITQEDKPCHDFHFTDGTPIPGSLSTLPKATRPGSGRAVTSTCLKDPLGSLSKRHWDASPQSSSLLPGKASPLCVPSGVSFNHFLFPSAIPPSPSFPRNIDFCQGSTTMPLCCLLPLPLPLLLLSPSPSPSPSTFPSSSSFFLLFQRIDSSLYQSHTVALYEPLEESTACLTNPCSFSRERVT